MNWNHEWESFLNAARKTSFPKVTRKKVALEMIANAVAAFCALIVYALLQKFVVVKSVRNLWGLAAKRDRMLVSKDTFEWISGILAFAIALFVFTYVEELIEKYLEERQQSKKEA